MVYETYDEQNDYLAHHGIDNQRWGIRHGPPYPLGKNLSRAIREQKRQSDKLAKNLRGYENTLGPQGNGYRYVKLANSAPMKQIAASMRKYWDDGKSYRAKTTDIENKFYKRGDFDYWVRRAAENDWARENKNGSLESMGWSYGKWLDWYRNDDGDQGSRTTKSFDMWLKESGEKEAKNYLEYEDKQISAYKKYDAECKKAVQSFLGEHGDEKYVIKSRWGNEVHTHERDLADRGVDVVTNIMNGWDTYTDSYGSVPIEKLMELVN